MQQDIYGQCVLAAATAESATCIPSSGNFFLACVFDADDLRRLGRNNAGERLYAEPRTCRRCRRARRKTSSSRPRHFAVGDKFLNGAAQGRGDRALNLGTLSKTTSPVPRLKPPDRAPRPSRSKSSLRKQQHQTGNALVISHGRRRLWHKLELEHPEIVYVHLGIHLESASICINSPVRPNDTFCHVRRWIFLISLQQIQEQS